MSDVKMLNRGFLRERFLYCRAEQVLYYRHHVNVRRAQYPIGTKRKSGHTYVKIKGYVFNVRDVVWVWHHGPVPPSGLRHKDGVKSNNRIDNIVPVNPAEWVSFL